MKRVLIGFLAAALCLSGCSKDSIDITDEPVDTSFKDNDGPEEQSGTNDDISTVTFTRTISIKWSGSTAGVEGDEAGTVSVSGGNVTVHNADTSQVVMYRLSGSCSNGSFKLYSSRKQALVLQDLELTSKSGAAINNQSRKRTFVVLEGTSKLADGSVKSDGDYSDQPSDEDCKAAFFSEGQLVFSGSGSLNVTATGKAGITSDDYLRFMGGQSVSLSSTAGHALRGKDAILIDDGSIVASTSAAGKKGMSSDGVITISGGNTSISVSGGTISEQVTTNGKTTTEYTGAAGVKADSTFCISGGVLTVVSSGQGGKGISGDRDALFKGGSVKVTVTGSNLSGGSTRTDSDTSGGPGGPGGPPGGGPGGSSNNLKSAKGIKFDGDITISGGSIEVSATSHEAIESKGTLTVTGGSLYAYSPADDAINCAGNMTLSGGFVCGWSTGNDGIDANGNLYVRGATVYAVSTKGSPEVAVDANTEGGYRLYLESGTLVAIGGIESGSSITGSAHSTTGWGKGKWNAVYDSNGDAVFSFMAPSSGGNGTMVLYCGGKQLSLKSGVTAAGETFWGGNGSTASPTGGSTVSLSTYTSSGRR